MKVVQTGEKTNSVRTCLILPCNLFVAPFYKRYERLMGQNAEPFDLIYWNRSGITEESKASNVYVFSKLDNSNDGNPSKVLSFLRFNQFIKKTVKTNGYSKLVFLGSFAANGLPIWRFLKRHFQGSYWYDIRDYTYEWFLPFYKRLCKVIENSAGVAISSPGYKSFLPKHKYVIAHNIDYPNIYIRVNRPQSSVKRSEPIRISFIGNVRYFDQNKKLIDAFSSDNRFILQYFGTGSEKLDSYAKDQGIRNVLCEGRFPPEETNSLYEKTDIINNVYGSDNIAKRTALSNKLYYALANKVPILVSQNTYMQEVLEGTGLSYVVADDETNSTNLSNSIYTWFDNEEFNQTRIDELWERVVSEDADFEVGFSDFVKQGDNETE